MLLTAAAAAASRRRACVRAGAQGTSVGGKDMAVASLAVLPESDTAAAAAAATTTAGTWQWLLLQCCRSLIQRMP